MGTWSTAINSNDTFLDIYSTFMDNYNQGKHPVEISKEILENYQDYFNDYDDRNNSLFALAFAQWETKSIDPDIFNQVKYIIETGNDIEKWKNDGADIKTLTKREAVLQKFLSQITTEREKPKRIKKQKFNFFAQEIINIKSPDNAKTFIVNKEFVNDNYIHTSGVLMWAAGGGGVVYYENEEINMVAKWLDAHTLELTCDKETTFTKKENSLYFSGDEVKFNYVIL